MRFYFIYFLSICLYSNGKNLFLGSLLNSYTVILPQEFFSLGLNNYCVFCQQHFLLNISNVFGFYNKTCAFYYSCKGQCSLHLWFNPRHLQRIFSDPPEPKWIFEKKEVKTKLLAYMHTHEAWNLFRVLKLMVLYGAPYGSIIFCRTHDLLSRSHEIVSLARKIPTRAHD